MLLTEKKRDHSLDIAKGIGMICVIAGHMGMQYINQVVYSFHMPLFFIVSGMLLKEDHSSSFLEKRGKALLKPYLLTALVLCSISFVIPKLHLNLLEQPTGLLEKALYWIKAVLYASGSNTNCFGITLPYIGEIWFLIALLIGLLEVNYFGTHKNGWLVVAVLAFVAYYTVPYGWMPLSLQSATIGAVFIEVGWIVKKYKLQQYLGQPVGILFCVILWLTALVMVFYTRTHMSLVRYELPHGLLDVFGAIGAVGLILELSRRISKRDNILNKLLLFFGENSLIVMCVHYIDTSILPLQQIYDKYLIGSLSSKLFFLITFLILRLFWTALGVLAVRKMKSVIR